MVARNARHLLLAGIIITGVVALVAVAPALLGDGNSVMASHYEDSNYEFDTGTDNVNDVRWHSYGDDPVEVQRAPGEGDRSWWSETIIHVVEPDEPLYLNRTIVYYSGVNDCETEDLDEFGIDRGNDWEGERRTDTEVVHTVYDSWSDYDKGEEFEDTWGHYARELDGKGLSDRYEPGEFHVLKTTVWWYNREQAGGDPPQVQHMDRFVTAQGECWANPEQEGWYRHAYSTEAEYENGTLVERDHPDFTHWFWICECSDRDEAVQTLGPPPSEQSGTDPTPTATPEADDDDDEPTPTATPESQDNNNDNNDDADPTPTATPEPEDNDGDGGSGAEEQQAPQTPVADQPGFGILAALLAIVGWIGLRRR